MYNGTRGDDIDDDGVRLSGKRASSSCISPGARSPGEAGVAPSN